MSHIQNNGKMYHIGLKAGDIGGYVLLPGDPKRCQVMAKYLDDAQLIAENREFVTYTGTLEGERVSITSTGIGGPSAAIALEELVAIGGHTFIRVGTSGGMAEHVLGGDVVIASGAIRMDGTSREYVPIEFPALASHELTCLLERAAQKLGSNYHIGVVQSKDSFYGQHSPERMPISSRLTEDWRAWISAGALASEMETATLFVVGSVLRGRVGSVLLVCGNQERAAAGLSNPISHDIEIPTKIAIEALRAAIKQARE